MVFSDLREYIGELEKQGKLKHVKNEVDVAWEVSCIGRWVFQAVPEKQRYGLFFDHPKGFDVPIVMGILGASREVYALALGTTVDKIFSKWSQALRNPISPKEVKSGPVHEVVVEGDEVNLFKIPVPTWTPGKDGGPYLTAACVITKDPDTRLQNVGTYRLQVQGRNRTGILIIPYQDIGIHFHHKYESRGKPMPVAIAIGVEPSIAITSVSKIPHGVEELAVAGGLKGSPVETVRAKTLDLQVPAKAEYVLEGEILPNRREKEGPFGEGTGYVTAAGQRNFIEIKCITHRKNPIYQAFTAQFPPNETTLMMSECNASLIYKKLVDDLGEMSIRDIHLTESSGSHRHILISMKPLYSGHAKRIGLLAANLMPMAGKFVTIVDDDIDIRDPFAVDWVKSNRVNPSTDVTIIERDNLPSMEPANQPQIVGKASSKPVPFEQNLSGSRMIIDATVKSVYPDLSIPPKEMMDSVLEKWESFGLPPIDPPERLRLLLEKHPAPTGSFIPF